MSLKDEAFTRGFGDSFPPDEGFPLTEVESAITEADMVASADNQEQAKAVSPLSPRTLRERRLQRYQEEERERIPEILGKILTSQYVPKPRHRIEGQLGKKGRRGL